MSKDNFPFSEQFDSVSDLIIKRLHGRELSAEESAILNEWTSRSSNNQQLYDRIESGELLVEEDMVIMERAEQEKEAVSKEVFKMLFPTAVATDISRTASITVKKFLIAAAVVLPLAISTYVFLNVSDKNKGQAVNSQQVVHDKLPGRDGAILRLSDGKEIILDDAMDGRLATEENAEIVKKGSELYYKGNSSPDKVLYNTLITPLGRQFQLRLPDNSRIWLNAGTSVTYPTMFGPKDRSIVVDGEVYLEVAEDPARPFRVAVQGTTIQVLGTKFNVNGYPKLHLVKTTLVEGKVSVTTGSASKTLFPGQQALVKNKNLSVVDDVDTENATAWKDGFIMFTGFDIHEVLDQISRWYQINIQYEGKVEAPDIKGRAYRNAPLSDVIKVLEISSGLRFTLKGDTLKVKKP